MAASESLLCREEKGKWPLWLLQRNPDSVLLEEGVDRGCLSFIDLDVPVEYELLLATSWWCCWWLAFVEEAKLLRPSPHLRLPWDRFIAVRDVCIAT